MDIEIDGRKLLNLGKMNVLLGKNGSGKSTLLRSLDSRKQALPKYGTARYITPERGGSLVYQGGIETSMLQDPNWGDAVRRNNRFDNFRQMSITEFRRLETLVLRKIEKDPSTRQNLDFSFDNILASINELLDHVRIVRAASTGFEILAKSSNDKRTAETLSSGESELVSLAIEILSFAYTSDYYANEQSYLFLDEPDVHLHPDLQERLMKLLASTVRERNITVVIATHSTAILGALGNDDEARVAFITSGQATVDFVKISASLRNILPIFGAHPLSSVFNSNPILLVEGDDDERIWQQAVRSSQGKLKIWPCQAGDIQSLDEYENQVDAIAGALYENAKAFSLRDRDDKPYEIDDKAIVRRARLFCRAAENLLLSDDVLRLLNTDWGAMKNSLEDWLSKYPKHPQFNAMDSFRLSGFNRLISDLKPLTNVIMMLAGSRKPWEVIVGQSIASLLSKPPISSENSLTSYLGPKLVEQLELRPCGGLSYLRARGARLST